MLRNTRPWPTASPTTILNEVLSLNAQEFHPTHSIMNMPDFLNEVLSLNAQECDVAYGVAVAPVSSMKS